jgi:hypothetical protein
MRVRRYTHRYISKAYEQHILRKCYHMHICVHVCMHTYVRAYTHTDASHTSNVLFVTTIT